MSEALWRDARLHSPTEDGTYLVILRVGSMNAKDTVSIWRGKMTQHYGWEWSKGDWIRVLAWDYLPPIYGKWDNEWEDVSKECS